MKRILKIVGIVVVVLIVILIAIPFFIDANAFRPRLESELTDALGREVKVGNLSLSLFQGAVSADNISIADDPKFSKSPFVQAKALKVGVEIMPLIFSKALNVTELTLNQPEISLVKSENGEDWNFSSLGTKTAPSSQPAAQATPAQPAAPAPAQPASSSAASQPNLSVAKLNIDDGRVTVSRAGSNEKPRVYDKVNIEVKNFSFASSFPFQMTADTPAGGNLKLSGNAGPINAGNAALTPLDAKISVQKMNLAASGFIDPAAGIAGIADLDGTVTSDGHQAKVNGTLDVSKLQVVQKGSPAGQPVKVTFAVVHDLAKQTGQLTQGDVAMGKAVSHLTGTYDAHNPVTSVDLKLNGQGMPVDDLEAMLPAVGVVLPPKASLKGGTLNLAMASAGPVDKLVTTGTVKLENTQLANFNLGSKLSSISALSGKNTGNDTVIQNFSSDVRNSPQGTQANNLNLTVPSIGVLTGGGTVSPSNELSFKMKADVGGMGVPFGITGTTSDPKFTPDVKGLATGLLQGVLGGQGQAQGKNGQKQNPADNVMGLFKKKPK
ncbi:MAG TPA: AsmA family protein [Candidatus Sulfotelmatobacter sp.]|jgi:AsmA protein|nr:AsmA family protein [Candidatus Sulfotelmatobacter sp.]